MYLVSLILTTNKSNQISHSTTAAHQALSVSGLHLDSSHAVTPSAAAAMPHHPSAAKARVSAAPGMNHQAKGPLSKAQACRWGDCNVRQVLMVRM